MIGPEIRRLRGLLDERYSRRADASNEALQRPTWIGRMGEFILTVEGHRQRQDRDLMAQFGDRLGILSKSLRISTLEDVEQFDLMLRSLFHFFPSLGYRAKDDPKIFTDEVAAWLSLGIKPETIGSWFKAVGGLACIDPTLFRQFFSSKRTIGGIKPLEGLMSAEAKDTIEEIKAVTGEQGPVLRRSKGTTTLDQLGHFVRACATELRKNFGEMDIISPVVEAAEETAELLEILKEEKYRSITILRPTPFGHLVAPTAGALVDFMNGHSSEEYEGVEEDLARQLVHAIRRRRLSLSRESLLSFCAAFRFGNQVGKKNIPEVAHPYIGRGLNFISRLMGGSPKSTEMMRKVANNVVPELIFQLRLRGLHTFEWSPEEYRILGLDNDLWKRHGERLRHCHFGQVPGREVVRPGDFVVDYYGQFEPDTVAHDEVGTEVGEIDPNDLINCGLLPVGFEGKVWVGVGPNSGNPRKKSREKPVETRWSLLNRAFAGAKGVFLFPQQDYWGPTLPRLQKHRDSFEEQGIALEGMAKLGGTDGLDQGECRYTPRVEPTGWEELNQTPHILALQMGELDDFIALTERLRKLKKSFPQSLILLVPFPEVHSSFVVERLGEISDETLATLVHPKNVAEIRKLWGK